MSKQYIELTLLIERLHRRFLDVLRTELKGIGVRDINGVQALILTNIGEDEVVIRDLIERGYYQGSNISYNIKKLTDYGYLAQERAQHDKRSRWEGCFASRRASQYQVMKRRAGGRMIYADKLG